MWKFFKKNWMYILLVLLVLYDFRNEYKRYVFNRFLRNVSWTQMATIIDFSNIGGVQRLSDGDSFTEILVGSNGSSKSGDGYNVNLHTINPSSVTLNDQTIILSWTHNGKAQTASVHNVGVALASGREINSVIFVSPVDGDDLKNIIVQESFGAISAVPDPYAGLY